MVSSYEERVQAWLHHRLCEQDSEIWSGGKQITVEEVRLNQENDELVILFRAVQYPNCLFGFCTSASPPQIEGHPDKRPSPDEGVEGEAEVIYANLQERVMSAKLGLPKNPSTDSVNWIGSMIPHSVV